MVFEVVFTKYYGYSIEADTKEEALEQAQEEFDSDMRAPIADLYYDGVEIYDEQMNLIESN